MPSPTRMKLDHGSLIAGTTHFWSAAQLCKSLRLTRRGQRRAYWSSMELGHVTVAITGATGFLGLHLVPELLDRHRSLTVLANAGSPCALRRVATFLTATGRMDLVADLADRVRVVGIDLTRPRLGLGAEAYRDLAGGIGELWHCAADVRLHPPVEAMRPVNVDGTRRVLDLAATGQQCPTVHHVSTAFVAGARRDGTVLEADLDGAAGFLTGYEQSKYEAELLVHAWSRTHGRPADIFRLSILTTDRTYPGLYTHMMWHLVSRVGAAARRYRTDRVRPPGWARPTIKVPGDPDGWANLVPVDAAAAAMARLGGRPPTEGVRTYHVVNARDVAFGELLAVLERAAPVRLRLDPRVGQQRGLGALAGRFPMYTPYLWHRRGYDDSEVRAGLGGPVCDAWVNRAYLLNGVRPVPLPGQAWSARRLTAVERAMLSRGDPSATANLTIGGLCRFDGAAPGLDEARRHVVTRLPALPRLAVAFERGRRWRRARRTEPDLRHHVHEVVLPPGSGWADLPGLVTALMAERFDPARPPWRAWLIRQEGVDGWAALFATHHALLDGMPALEVLRILLDRRVLDRVAAPRPAAASTWRERGTVVRRAPRFLQGFLPLRRAPFARTDMTGERDLTWVGADLDQMWALAARHGVRLNDVFLAALAGALRDCPQLPWRRGRIRPVWTLVPVDVGTHDGCVLGNRVAFLRVRLPCHIGDPGRRLAEVIRQAAAARRSARAAPRSLPGWCVRPFLALAMSRWCVAAAASNMAGPRDPVYYRDSRLLETVPLGPLLRSHPVDAYFVTCDGRGSVGFATDAGLGVADEMCRQWTKAVDELAGLTWT